MTAIDRAIREARRIRRNLVRRRGDKDLGGDCALASVLLASSIDNAESLRHAEFGPRVGGAHVWNVVGGMIIDITATQFNDRRDCDEAGEPPVFGVLVTRAPRLYHHGITMRGRQILEDVQHGWYENEEDIRQLNAAIERLRDRTRMMATR